MDPHSCWKLYPKEYAEWIISRDEKSVFLRPIKPSDGSLIEDLFSKLSPTSIYFRFLSHLDRLRPEILYHLIHIDYESEFALAATIQEKERGDYRCLSLCVLLGFLTSGAGSGGKR